MTIVDLFTGVGGLTFGFYYKLISNKFVKNTNNEFIFANEIENETASMFSVNFPDINMIKQDIKDMTKSEIKAVINHKKVDLIIGGPPCQSFSTIGKRIYDDRAKLYNEYFRILSVIRPKAFLFENVKGILSMRDTKGLLVIDAIKKKFKRQGYKIYCEVLNAVDYGIPQSRERVFIVGIRDDLRVEWKFPKPLKKPKLTIKDAISDLPAIKEGCCARKYKKGPNNQYQELMRKNSKEITGHFCGMYGEKIRVVIRSVKQGEGKNDFNNLVDAGKISEKYRLTSGYANTYGRLNENLPSTTITNNLSSPSSLRCIHYSQNRALTPREGARIQSFPDWFRFSEGGNMASKQIGNAVPPLLAMILAKEFEKIL